MNFLWTDGTTPPSSQPLQEDVHTEMCVIGGGMAGVLCAAQLTAQGIDNVLLEARQVGEGITKGTTAVLTAQHGTLYRVTPSLPSFNRHTRPYSSRIRHPSRRTFLERVTPARTQLQKSRRHTRRLFPFSYSR